MNPKFKNYQIYQWTEFPRFFLMAALFISLLTGQSVAADRASSLEEINKITEAAPDKPTVEPAKPRKLLVFSISWGYWHSSIPYGKKAVEIMGKKTGAFEAVVSDDISMFEPQNLQQFDAVFFNNTNNELFLPKNFDKLPPQEQEKAKKYDEALKKSLVDFISAGKGLAVIHAGVASFRKWSEFGNIIGARFDNHPWGAGSTVALKVDEPSHPLTQAFKRPLFVVADEIYQVKNPYSRQDLRVLLSVDTGRTNIKLDNVNQIHRSDKDFAISWVKSYGQGRVFYCALGHQHDLFWNPVILQHYLDGIQFTLGDLKADTTPSAKVTAAELRLRVLPSKADFINVPVHAAIELPGQFSKVTVEKISVLLKEQGGSNTTLPGQIVMDERGKAQLWWILPQAKTDASTTWTATLKHKKPMDKTVFFWQDHQGQYLDLLFKRRKVTRYIYAYDDSTPHRKFETCKPFHHVFDGRGEHLLTSGPDGINTYREKDFLYPHHRGLFIGWNSLEFDSNVYDTWHMKGAPPKRLGAAQVHKRFVEMTAGPVLARCTSLVDWNGENGEHMLSERRRTTVFCQPDPTVLLLDFRTQLKALNGDVFLNGDPEHAGFQFRPHNDVAKGSERAKNRISQDYVNVKAVYHFHKDGVDPRRDFDLPWVQMSYGLNGRRYHVQYMNHPENPRPSVFSAYRDYGRFGAFFKHRINTGQSLPLSYRVLVVEDKMPDRQKLADQYHAFIDSPEVRVLK